MTDTTAELAAVAKSLRRPWGLRRRILTIFVLGTLGVSALLAFTTYALVRSSLLQQREVLAQRNGAANARRAFGALSGNPATSQPAIEQLNSAGVDQVVIYYGNKFESGSPTVAATDLPVVLQEMVIDQNNSARMVVDVRGQSFLIIGYPLGPRSAYFEFSSLDDIDSTLASVRLALIVGSLITGVAAVLAGTFAARGAVRPLGEAANAAEAIAGGRLDTRLTVSDDPDLALLTNSFNDMAAALERRIERDARFASDVSHELRSPLMTLSASVEVMDARRDELPERSQSALDLLKGDVIRFQGLVEDLLEISRFDAGAVQLNSEELLATEFVRQAVAASSNPATPITERPGAGSLLIEGDRRRLARVVANLIDNARLHGGGQAEIDITPAVGEKGQVLLRIEASDHGPGVDPDQRDMIFERFARGGLAGRRADSDGAGLGLAIVDEHVRMHGGRVWVDDRLDGTPGARFIVELPAEVLET